MYEEIDLDAIESNKDESPDYRPLLKAAPSGSPSSIEYRMRYLSTLESSEKASYAEFAKIAEKEGLMKIAKMFREILQEEKGHEKELADTSSTLMNLKASLKREKDKVNTIKSTINAAEKQGDSDIIVKLNDMLKEEQGHVEKFANAINELEKKMDEMKERKESKKEPKEVCSFGVCVPKY
jgi:rubrerythrin